MQPPVIETRRADLAFERKQLASGRKGEVEIVHIHLDRIGGTREYARPFQSPDAQVEGQARQAQRRAKVICALNTSEIERSDQPKVIGIKFYRQSSRDDARRRKLIYHDATRLRGVTTLFGVDKPLKNSLKFVLIFLSAPRLGRKS
ncbi:hypothetical protein D5I55_03185 [Chakrabartia godavariana]|nr:hypothetical protein D5I55_03185 [Chakrabartia godavariana]